MLKYKLSFILISIYFFFSSLFAQNQKLKTKTYFKEGDTKLELDIYYTKSKEARPLIIYLHGGGFMGGDRSNEPAVKFCTDLAKKEFVAVSVSYRLTLKGKSFSCDCPKETKINTFASAMEDVWRATEYVKKYSRKLNFDPNKIILAGSSAGAEAILHAGFQVDTSSFNISYAGIISMAGAIVDTNKISSTSAIPTLLFHGTCDPLVPYGSAAHHYCDSSTAGALLLHGSKSISNRLSNLNVVNWLSTSCGSGHNIAGLPIWDNVDLIAKFCQQIKEDSLVENYREINTPTDNVCDYPQFECGSIDK